MIRWAVVLAIAPMAPPAHAQDIFIQGEITRETLTQFIEALRVAPRPRVVLDGPGGEVLPALEIGRIIRERRLPTLIPERATCASACGLIWLAGTPRLLGPQAMVGFHAAATIAKSGRRSVSAPGNAIVGGYLRELAFDDQAITEMTRAPPRGMNWFDARRMGTLGLTAVSRAEPSSAPPATPSAPPPLASLDGLWEGEFRCGREVRTARLMVWRESARHAASFEFGPTDASPNLPHGALQLRGAANAEGRLRFQANSAASLAPGERAFGLLAWVEGAVMRAEVTHRPGCPPMSLRKAAR